MFSAFIPDFINFLLFVEYVQRVKLLFKGVEKSFTWVRRYMKIQAHSIYSVSQKINDSFVTLAK